MSFLRHILIALGYSIISAAVELTLPRFFNGIDPNTSIMLGAVVLVGSALLHEVFARQEDEGRLVECRIWCHVEFSKREKNSPRSRFNITLI